MKLLCVQAVYKILDTKYFRRIYCNSEVVLAKGYIRSTELEPTRFAEIKKYIPIGCVHTCRKVCLHQQVKLMQRAYSKNMHFSLYILHKK